MIKRYLVSCLLLQAALIPAITMAADPFPKNKIKNVETRIVMPLQGPTAAARRHRANRCDWAYRLCSYRPDGLHRTDRCNWILSGRPEMPTGPRFVPVPQGRPGRREDRAGPGEDTAYSFVYAYAQSSNSSALALSPGDNVPLTLAYSVGGVITLTGTSTLTFSTNGSYLVGLYAQGVSANSTYPPVFRVELNGVPVPGVAFGPQNSTVDNFNLAYLSIMDITSTGSSATIKITCTDYGCTIDPNGVTLTLVEFYTGP